MKTKIILPIFIIVILAMIIFLFKDKIKKLFQPKGETQPGTNTITNEVIKYVNAPVTQGTTYTYDTPIPPAVINLDTTKVLKKGSKGAEVKRLQEMINEALKLKKKQLLVADGSFGQKTLDALSWLTAGKFSQITLAQATTLFIAGMTVK